MLNPEKVATRKITRKAGRVVDVACGQFTSFLVTDKGRVIGFGLNNCYQLGDFGDREVRYTPEIIPFEFDDERITVKQVSSGMHHTVILSKQGKF